MVTTCLQYNLTVDYSCVDHACIDGRAYKIRRRFFLTYLMGLALHHTCHGGQGNLGPLTQDTLNASRPNMLIHDMIVNWTIGET